MTGKISLKKLQVRLFKDNVTGLDSAIKDPHSLKSYPLKPNLDVEGRLYIVPEKQNPPSWVRFIQNGTEKSLNDLFNTSNSAILLILRQNHIFAFTFGHSHHLLNQLALEPDFGIRTALNGLKPDSIRSIDTYTIEEQTIHKRSQASKAASLDLFGLDISRDILRAVTGDPLDKDSFHTLAGVEALLSVTARVDFFNLALFCDKLLKLYHQRVYKKNFSWVDNMRRVTDTITLGQLDARLFSDLQKPTPTAYLSPPEPIEWAEISGFTYSNRTTPIEPDLQLTHYLSAFVTPLADLKQFQEDKANLHIPASTTPTATWPVYKCLIYETDIRTQRYVLSNGQWFEIDHDFSKQVLTTISSIPSARIALPAVRSKPGGGLESEPDYNARAVSEQRTTALLDGKTAKCRFATSGIEPCDLLTKDLDLIHVKHRKGGSSSLSHLFAQGRVSAEALINDEQYRREVRNLLKHIQPSWEARIPLKRPTAHDYRIVFLILGTASTRPAMELPFFSQINLARTYEFLRSRNFRVALIGVPISP